MTTKYAHTFTRRMLPGLLLAILLLPVACTAPAPPPPTAAPSAAPGSRPTSLPPTAIPPPPPTTTPLPESLLLWTTETGTALALVEELAADFAAATGLEMTVEAREPAALRLGLLAAAADNEPPPDLIWADGEDLADLRLDGQLRSLGSSFAAEGFLPALVSAAQAENQLWGMPISAQQFMLLYANRALIDSLPATSDELIVQSRAAHQGQSIGLLAAWYEARWLLPWLNGFGGAPIAADGETITLDTPEMQATLELLRELRVSGAPATAPYRSWSAAFAAGEAALAIDGDWALESYRSFSETLDLAIAPLPIVPATGQPAAPVLVGSYLLLPARAPDAALAWLRAFSFYLHDPERQVDIAQRLNRLPALQLAVDELDLADDPVLAAIAPQATAALGLPPTIAQRCALRAINRGLPSIEGAQPIADISAAMQRDAETCATSRTPGTSNR
jgi:arabinogalactan oligomer / maltooligosaccharide transport system substrate-binding protein